MKNLGILVALFGVAIAQRQPSKEVINKFKEISPQYMSFLETGETQLAKVRNDSLSIVIKFHDEIILVKENYVLNAIEKESELHSQITSQQESVDSNCVSFLNTTLDMNMNLVGVGFTNCINNADESFEKLSSEYYRKLGMQEALIAEIRLLDVFRGNNVFYSPEKIIENLNKKLSDLNISPNEIQGALEEAKEILVKDLDAIRSTYVECMTQGERLFDRSLEVIVQQLTIVCLAQTKELTTEPGTPRPITIESDEIVNRNSSSIIELPVPNTVPNRFFNPAMKHLIARSPK
ncbi:uncharacterized protein LOC131427243 [Malaya genurostris]|uniref:uncharacterized protein LOC131427243 n=1 Tax=Malaya genurostris TaxID=325434 RepID=UPI0026F3F893|nr:uncharacterized protein LOC131427243 [Malaya genurostris]